MEPVEVEQIETVEFTETDDVETMDMNFSGQSSTTVSLPAQNQPSQSSKDTFNLI